MISTATDLDLTLDAIRVRGWQAVLLAPRSKVPDVAKGEAVIPTKDLDAIRCHIEAGGNIGLRCHEDTGLAILDADDLVGWDAMSAVLGPLTPWVRTGRDRLHYPVVWEANLPGTILWKGQRLGEALRGPGLQQVVAPPSVHPKTGRRYSWLVDPVTEPLRPLPDAWRAALRPVRLRPSSPPPSSPSPSSLSAADLEAAALQQPGARRRHDKIKFQCPQCAEEGHDLHEDNAALFLDTGTWGCAYSSGAPAGRRHWLAIGVALGALRSEFVQPPWTRRTP